VLCVRRERHVYVGCVLRLIVYVVCSKNQARVWVRNIHGFDAVHLHRFVAKAQLLQSFRFWQRESVVCFPRKIGILTTLHNK